jgi:hypothetical protein
MKRKKSASLATTDAFRPDGLLHQGQHGRAHIVHMRVPDPMPDSKGPPGQQSIAAVNTKRDVLLFEYGRGKISEAAFAQGRLIQAALEIQGGSGASQWAEGDRVDAGSLVAWAIAKGIDRARAATGIIAVVHRELGKIDGAVVILSLRQPGTWSDMARAWGRDDADMRKELSARFRRGLEHLGALSMHDELSRR